MSHTEIMVPDIGTDGDVEVIELLVNPGDEINVDDPILVLESDKASMEVPATASGKVEEFKVQVGDKVKEGDLLLLLSGSADTEHVNDDATSSDEGNDDESNSKDEESSQPKHDEPSGDEEEDKSDSDKRPVSESGQIKELTVPDLGGADEVEVIELTAEQGQELAVDDAVIVLESDKASMDIPTPFAGKLVELVVSVGDKVKEGDLIAKIESLDQESPEKAGKQSEAQISSSSQSDSEPKNQNDAQDRTKAHQQTTNEPTKGSAAKPKKSGSVHAGPAVRKLARELGVELERVKATGPKGRIQKDDLNAYIKEQVQTAQSGTQVGGIAAPKLPDFSKFGPVESRKLDKIQLVTARNMQTSWSNVPHVTQFDEADITELEAFRKSKKSEAEHKNVKLTPLPFLIKASARALKELPQFNVSLDLQNQQMIQKGYFHIGVAVDTAHGLVVPVIRDVLDKDLWEISAELGELAEKAKDRKLSPSEMQGACFTISSLGSIGGTAFTPIVNLPEVAILGVSKAMQKPVYVEGAFEPRLMLPLSLSYDHRAVNGADAARFTSLIGKYLSDIRELLF